MAGIQLNCMSDKPFIKRLIYTPLNDDGYQVIHPIFHKVAYLDKLAARADLNPKVAAFISNIKADPNHRYVLINALGAGEYYGANKNADYFEEQYLSPVNEKYGHKTFLKAGVYKHHVSAKKGGKSSGKVVLAEYNPEMHRVELVLRYDVDKDPDMIQRIDNGESPPYSMGCFKAGTKITLSDGRFKEIENIEVGDRVLNGYGKETVVTSVGPRETKEQLYKISHIGEKETFVTGNHPFLVFSKDKVKDKQNRFFPDIENLNIKSAEWKHANCLTTDDFLIRPVDMEVLTPDYVSVAAARILGYYLSEGHLIRNKNKGLLGIQLTTHKDDPVHKEIKQLCAEFGTMNNPIFRPHQRSEKAIYIFIHDKKLAEFCYEHAGSLAKHKTLSESFMKWHPDYQIHMLGTYINGDGCQLKKQQREGQVYLSTANYQLAYQMATVLARCGMISTINTIRHLAGPNSVVKVNTIEYQTRIPKSQSHKLVGFSDKVEQFDMKFNASGSKKLINSGFIISPVLSIERMEEVHCGPVYNFEVAKGESYVANGMAVHNCVVPYDICSVQDCGKKSKTASDYCEHMIDNPGPNEILSDGQRVFVYNPNPDFFDISRVAVGADKTAKLYGKLASLKVPGADTYPTWFSMPSGLLAIKCGDVKDATITKEIPAVAEPISELNDFNKSKQLLSNYHEKHVIDPHDLKKVAWYGMDSSLSTFASLGITLNPSEFQYLVLHKMNKPELAESLNKIGCVFTKEATSENVGKYKNYIKIDYTSIDPQLLKLAAKYLPTRSVLFPYLLQRAYTIKSSSARSITPRPPLPIKDLAMVSDLYHIYLAKLAHFGPEGVRSAAKHVPAVQMILQADMPEPFSLDRTFSENEKVAAEEGVAITVKDFVTGSLLSPLYKTSTDVLSTTEGHHYKVAQLLSEVTPTRLHRIHPDTSAWMSVLTINSSFKQHSKGDLNG